ncbi:MAG: FtsK/SpoIIIE domain-containing protein [Acidimicrobiales bacterium]
MRGHALARPSPVDLDAMGSLNRAPFRRTRVDGPFALADDPLPMPWAGCRPMATCSSSAGGVAAAAASLALSAAVAASPGDLHLYLIDFGAGELAPLAALPHVGALITAGERERQVRLIRWLGQEIDRRRALPDARTAEPRLVLILDGLSGFRSEWDDAAAPMTADLQRVFGAGPEVGIHSVVTADRAGVVPGAIQSLTRQRWLFRLGDPSEFALIGVRAAGVPDFHPGGALVGEGRAGGAGRTTGRWSGRGRGPDHPRHRARPTELAGPRASDNFPTWCDVRPSPLGPEPTGPRGRSPWASAGGR